MFLETEGERERKKEREGERGKKKEREGEREGVEKEYREKGEGE